MIFNVQMRECADVQILESKNLSFGFSKDGLKPKLK